MLNALRIDGFDVAGGHDIVGQVYETTDYDVFRFRPDNRRIKENIKLRESLKRVGILSPIVVNEKMEIIDGQGRVTLAMKLRIKVPYIVKNGFCKREIIELNTSGNKWEIVDFIETYASEGIDEYEKMWLLLERYDVAPGVLCGLAFNTTDGSGAQEKTRNGQLKFVNHDFLVTFLDFYEELTTETIIKTSAQLANSLYTLYRLEKFNGDRIFQKSGDIAMRINGMSKQGAITEAILQSYNERLRGERGNSINYRKNAKGNIEFVGEKVKSEIR
jgi:hypothetical protein